MVEAKEIAERSAVTVTENIRGVPGVDATTGGIAQTNIVTRGFNNAFSGALLTLQDYRFAAVPSLRVNVPLLFTGTGDDIERIEVLLGPASALYGPNSSSGVLHVITKSPFESKGAILTLDGGERSILHGAGRYAATVGQKFGIKLSGEAFTGKDWEYVDPAEPATIPRPNGTPGERDTVANVRDFDVKRYAGEARMDIRPRNDMRIDPFTVSAAMSPLTFLSVSPLLTPFTSMRPTASCTVTAPSTDLSEMTPSPPRSVTSPCTVVALTEPRTPSIEISVYVPPMSSEARMGTVTS